MAGRTPPPERLLDARDKSFPPSAAELSVAEFLARAPSLDEFTTPLLTLDDHALRNNLAVMAGWIAERGFELMPHGKTTMAPALWFRQLAAGATGITVATPWQARVALTAGVPVVLLANELVDPVGLGWIAAHLRTHPAQTLLCWADSLDAVEIMERTLAGLGDARPLDVLVELGGAGGRTGARGIAAATAIADRVAASPRLSLHGVAGYEGALGHDRTPESVAGIRAYLASLAELHQRLADRFETDRPIVSAGGSAFPDVVAEVLGPLAGGLARVVLRSGAYLTHDSGYYARTSPLALPDAGQPRLLPASWGLARVLSRPEPGLALLGGGKRDFPYDDGLPVGVAWRGSPGGAERPLPDLAVRAMNDQHTFLATTGAEPSVGAVVRLGLSHPCTAFDKWRLIPVVDPGSGLVVDVVETHF